MASDLATDPRTWFTLATAVSLSPLVVAGLSWVLSLPCLQRFGLGILLGVGLTATFQLTQLHRSYDRRSKALHTVQLCQLDNAVLRRLVPEEGVPSWIGQAPAFEKVTWLNKQLEEIWPTLNEATSGLLKEVLQSVLDPYKFSIIQNIKVQSITLGTLIPLIGGIKLTEADPDECILEAELDWRHGQDSKLVIQLQTTGPLLTVQVKNFIFFGVLKLTFKPLMDQFPGFGAVTLSLREPPIVNFQTNFLGGDVLMIPGIGNVIDNIILTALMDTLVWPNRLVIPIMDGDYSYLQLKPLGELEVELLEARDLSKQDFWGESDPFAVMYIRRKQGCIRTSSIKSNTHSPVWNERFSLDVEDLETQKLTIRVLDDDPFKPPDFIGVAELPLIQFIPNQHHDIWVNLVVDLQKPEQKSRGEVHLCILYKPFNSGETDTKWREGQVLQKLAEADDGKNSTLEHEKAMGSTQSESFVEAKMSEGK